MAFSRFIQILFFALLATASIAWAETAAFDLPGPHLEVRVTRGEKTLPISQVPNLQAGDRIWLHPDLPKDQSARYLMIAAFLRGSTNPPPENWFVKAETWKKAVQEEGIVVTVPEDAQQMLVFFAPETGGDYSSLRSAVRGRPGAFVRASQDLNRASLDRSRLDAYLNAVQETSDYDPKALHERSLLLARSLSIKLDQQCFDKPTEQQAPCLTQNTDQLVLDDGHSQSMAAALTSGAPVDLVGQLSNTTTFGAGTYSPYVGAIVDVARIMTSFRNPEYQFIPALALAKQDHLELRLNNPPSFRKPKSVIVVGLPAVEAAHFPPLRPSDPKEVYCLQKPALVLPMEGAPLVYSTNFAHDVVLRVQSKSGTNVDLPATADAARGGFVIGASAAKAISLGPEITGSLHGAWGFQSFDGPTVRLQNTHSSPLTLVASDANSLIVGRENVLHLRSTSAACVDTLALRDERGQTLPTVWKLLNPDEIEVKVSLKDAAPGSVTLSAMQPGLSKPDQVALRAYAEAGHLGSFSLHAGDQQGVLKGTRLDEVSGLDLNGVHFAPAGLTRANNEDELVLAASDARPLAALSANDSVVPHVTLKDGRVLDLKTTVEAPRPQVTLLSKSVQSPTPAVPGAMHLSDQSELPQNGRILFSLKARSPATFSHSDKIEIVGDDNSFRAQLGDADGGVTLLDSHTMLVTLDPLKSFGPSAFGPLRFRLVQSDGVTGDWQPLGVLVRLPLLKEVHCPKTPDNSCTLVGTNLFLLDAVAADPQFVKVMPVPEGFADSSLSVPHPDGTRLYLKLRDNPTVINEAEVPVLPQ